MTTDSFSRPFPGFAEFIRRNADRFPMLIELVAAAIAFVDPATPAWARAILGAAITYVLCPLDAIPDFIPIAGWMDDIAVLGGTLTGVARLFVTDEHRRRASEILGLG